MRSVGHRFSGTDWLFRGVSLILEPGRTYALRGPSGSGKSTLLSIIAGWEKPLEGEIVLTDISKTGWVFQSPHGIPRRPAIEHVMWPLLDRGLSLRAARQNAEAIMKEFGLISVLDRNFNALSGGEAQRVMFARAVAAKNSLILVDEPTAQLDTQTRHRVNGTISRLADDGSIVVVATHDEETSAACTDVIDLAMFTSSLFASTERENDVQNYSP